MTNNKTKVGILGGGISGLSTAYALSQKGISATVYEQREEVGGAIRSVRRDGWLVEEGPNTLMIRSETVWDLLENVGLGGALSEANQLAKKRFVVKDGRPVALPSSLGSFLTSPLLSLGGKLRLLKEPFVAPSPQQDESIARFIRRRLGSQPLDYGVNPFVSGIYAGDPKELSVKHTFESLWQMEQKHGSLLKGLLKRDRSGSTARRGLISFPDGLQTLPRALAEALPGPVHTSATVNDVKHTGTDWRVCGTDEGTAFETRHDCLVSTLPTYGLPDVFGKRLFGELAELPYAPISVLALGFTTDQINHSLDGFGMLIPEIEGYKMLGVLFSSTLFPGRAPEEHHLLTCFIGGDRNPGLASKSKEILQTIVLDELGGLLGINGLPVFTHHHAWDRAIPQYKVGFDHYLSLMREIEHQHPGLFLEGNFRGGVSVPDCISSGVETAQKVHTFLQSVS